MWQRGWELPRWSLDLWLDSRRIHPRVVGEFDDSALMFWFGQSGAGVFAAPTMMAETLRKDLDVESVGRVGDVRERFYAISMEPTLKHPAVVAMCEAARETLLPA